MKLNRFAGAALAALLLSGGVAVAPASATPPPSPSTALIGAIKDASKLGLPPAPSGAGTAGVARGKSDLKAVLKDPKGYPTLKKGGVTRSYPQLPCDGVTKSDPCYRYAGWIDDFGLDRPTGISIDMTIGDPYLARPANNNTGSNDGHSLIELAIGTPASTSGEYNIIEVGSTQHEAVCNNGVNTDPCLFIFRWVNGVPLGYNMDPSSGFRDLAGLPGYSTIHPGDSLAGHVGTQRTFTIRYLTNAQTTNREGWWIQYDGLFVGYYPIAVYTGVGETFVDVHQPQVFSELAGYGNYESCSDLGTGEFGSSSNATTSTNYTAYDTTETLEMDWVPNQTEPSAWNVVFSGGSPPTTARFGGPGYNSIGGTTGYKNTCGPSAAGTSAASSWQFWREIAPDNQAVTGAQNAVNYTYTSTPIGTCYTVLNWGAVPINAFHNNASSSGKTIQLFKTNNCTGTAKTFGNQGKEAFAKGSGWEGYNIRTFKRTA